MNATHAENFIRSATAPVIKAGVMMANIIWKVMNRSPSASRPESPTKSKPPMMPPLSVPKASVYPIRVQVTVTIEMVKKFFISMLSTFLERTMPP